MRFAFSSSGPRDEPPATDACRSGGGGERKSPSWSWSRSAGVGWQGVNAWGWIRPEDVLPEDLLETDPDVLALQWDRLVNSPALQTFDD